MKWQFRNLFVALNLLVLLVFGVLGCSLIPEDRVVTTEPGAIDTAVAGTVSAGNETATAKAGLLTPTWTAEPTETSTLIPTNTSTPVPTAPPTLLQLPFIDENGNIVLWKEGEGLIPLTSGGGVVDLRISDDGTLVAYLRQFDFGEIELRLVDVEGNEDRLLVDVETFQAMDSDAEGVLPTGLAWVPGTHVIAFNTREFLEGPGLILYDDIRMVNTDTGELTTFLEPGEGGRFSFSPSGEEIAFSTPTTLSLIRVDGSNLRRNVLTYESVLTYSEYRFYAQPNWAPDSSLLRLAIPAPDPLAEPIDSTGLYQIPLSGDPAEKIGSIKAVPFFMTTVKFSPDLSKIAYLRLIGEGAGNQVDLVIANADGSNQQVYTSGNVNFLVWSPDSKHFVFRLEEPEGVYWGQIGAEYTPFTDTESAFGITWVNPSRFVFLRERDERWEIRLGTPGKESLIVESVPGPIPQFDVSD